ncbi:hypothetical protein HPULCUR_010926 [Helicostylum pulchrum]|uniref:Uncharacterized protein n=1 Tax=Helicostylum pulchrum TaxID=562976 RepID=A0ABP9YEM4_9FUNG
MVFLQASSLYYKFRNSITCTDLLYNENPVNFNSQQINTLNLFAQFKKLIKLELRNIDDINLTPFQIQDNCPNLEHLDFSSHYPVSDSVMQHILDNKRRIILNCISNLTDLELELPSLSAVYMAYLVDYFPNQLTDLTISICTENMFNWIDIVGMELALSLMDKSW